MEGQTKNRNGFTMVSDYLAWKYQDYVLAEVYAKIERFCSLGKDRICDASIETLREELVIKTDRTVKERIDLLKKDGYIIDSTSNLVNRTHHRTVTEKLQKEESEFQEWAEEYREERIRQGSKLPSYYDCFQEYANQQKISSYLSKISEPKKPRGKNGGRKKKSEIKLDYSVINERITSNQPLISQYSTIDYDNTIDTSETIETFKNKKIETSDFASPEGGSSSPQVENQISKEESDNLNLEISNTLNKDFNLSFSSEEVSSSENVSKVEATKLASSDVDTSSESIEQRYRKAMQYVLDRKMRAKLEEEYFHCWQMGNEFLKGGFISRLESLGY